MRPKIAIAVALVVAASLAGAAVVAQNTAPPSLQEQLEAEYKLAKVGKGPNGLGVTTPGTVLIIQKAGMQGVPLKSLAAVAAIYSDGALRPPSKKSDIGTGFLRGVSAPVSGVSSRQLLVGEKVYATKINANLKDDKVEMHIVECDACNAGMASSSFKSEVIFQFAKGYLAKASVPDVEDTIAQVFVLDTSAPVAQPVQPPPQPEQPAAPPPAPAQAEPASIQLGQTPAEVVAVLGQPEKKVNLGSKQIYLYKDLKVTFLNGKVSDVQ
ncbi:MAG: hypothetical protein ACLQVL_16505 [Terriglobia bacterium]